MYVHVTCIVVVVNMYIINQTKDKHFLLKWSKLLLQLAS